MDRENMAWGDLSSSRLPFPLISSFPSFSLSFSPSHNLSDHLRIIVWPSSFLPTYLGSSDYLPPVLLEGGDGRRGRLM